MAQAGEAPPCLVLLVGPENAVGRQWPIEKSENVLGRSESSQIFVKDKSISKAHAKLQMVGGEVNVVDLQSTNKTVVNGQVIPPMTPIKLTNNDQIKTGNVIFKFLERGNIETVSAAETFGRGVTDPLTGIANRAGMNSRGTESFAKSDLLGVPLSIITFDIDHFKKFNDTYGHTAGDYVLQELSRVVRDNLIRGNDFFARTGGEEFTLLLLGSSEEMTEQVAERIRTTVESHQFEYKGTPLKVTISLGASVKQNNDSKWEDIFERADKALYVSKNGGRNRVSMG